MAVNLSAPTELRPVAGVELAAAEAKIRYRDRPDLALIALAPGTVSASVFTRNAFCAAPVSVAKQHLAQATPRYLLINAGNANAGTGAAGLAAATATCAAVAAAAGCEPHEVLPFSTGVIGEPLPVERFVEVLPSAVGSLAPQGWLDAARAIMTTDTVPKGISRTVTVGEREATITGIAKGSGMIRPDMATMLAFIATDAEVAQPLLQRCLQEAVDESFNAVTVDGDTSTNDACLLMATGRSGAVVSEGGGYAAFAAQVRAVCQFLAQAMIRDGEGATKFVTVEVCGAAARDEAREVAFTVAHSPLVKTALFASDPNWGRILAAVGRAGITALDVARVDIHLGEVCIVRNGARAESYTEEAGQGVMQAPEITIRIDLNRGQASTQVWTCDFSYDYVKINADYRS